MTDHWIKLSYATAPNWNSYGGVPTTNEALTTASSLVSVPMADGGMQIELHAGGADVEIVIGPDGKVRSVLWEAET